MLYPEAMMKNMLYQQYQFSPFSSDSSQSIFTFTYIAVVPVHIEIPLLNSSGKQVSNFKLMAKLIGKNGIFLKTIKQNCEEAFPKKVKSTKPNMSICRIELTKVFSKESLQQHQRNHFAMEAGVRIAREENQLSEMDELKRMKEEVENQVCHIQVASNDEEVFEYALQQVLVHASHIYTDYQTQAHNDIVESSNGTLAPHAIKDLILVPMMAIQPYLFDQTPHKIGSRMRQENLNLKARFLNHYKPY